MKKFLKIILFLFLFFQIFLVNASVVPIEEVFKDVDKSYKYYKELQLLYDRGIIFPDKDGNFNPNGVLTRDEFVWIVTEVSCKECIQPDVDFSFVTKYSNKNIFFDVAKTDKYFYCIADAYESWRIRWYQEWTSCQNWVQRDWEKPFCPKNDIILEEALAIIMRASNVLSLQEAEDIRKEVLSWKSFPILPWNIWPYLKTGWVYSFYPDFKKAFEYSFSDFDKDWNEKKIKFLDFTRSIDPKRVVTREDFLRMSYIALQNNSCLRKKREDFWLRMEVFDKTCSEDKANCPYSKLYWTEKIFDFRAVTSREDDKDYIYDWRFYNYRTWEEIFRKWKYLDNYDFLNPWKYRVTLTVDSRKGDVSEVYNDIKIFEEKILKVDDSSWDLKLKIFDKSCSTTKEICDLADFSWNETVFDLRWEYPWDYRSGYDYTWKIYSYNTWKQDLTIWKHIDNYDFETPWKYRLELTLSLPDNTKKTISRDIFLNEKYSDLWLTSSILTDKLVINPWEFINFTGLTNFWENDVTYFWDFSDWSTQYWKRQKHPFYTPWVYPVYLVIVDKDWNTSGAFVFIEVISEEEEKEKDKDTDWDGIGDPDDYCPTLKWDRKNFGCPIFEKKCKVDSDCAEWEICIEWYCKVKQFSLNCAYTWWDIVRWNLECTTCPCNYNVDFNSTLRSCDIIFPAITSPDNKNIFSKWKYFQIKK